MPQAPKTSSWRGPQRDEDPVGGERRGGGPAGARCEGDGGSERQSGEPQDRPDQVRGAGEREERPERAVRQGQEDLAADGKVERVRASAAETGQSGRGAERTPQQRQRGSVERQRRR